LQILASVSGSSLSSAITDKGSMPSAAATSSAEAWTLSVVHYVSVDLFTREEHTVCSLNIRCHQFGLCAGFTPQEILFGHVCMYICSLHIHTYLMYTLTVQGNVPM